MLPDRKLQLKILEELKTAYPNEISIPEMTSYYADPDFMANLFYLYGHGLINGDATGGIVKAMFSVGITEKGIDFLADDGGLSAIFNKVHVKFDEEDLSKLLTIGLAKTEMPVETKKEVLKTIKGLPAEGIKTVYTHLLNLGLKNWKEIPQLVQHVQDMLT
jgi:hypothetical protein